MTHQNASVRRPYSNLAHGLFIVSIAGSFLTRQCTADDEGESLQKIFTQSIALIHFDPAMIGINDAMIHTLMTQNRREDIAKRVFGDASVDFRVTVVHVENPENQPPGIFVCWLVVYVSEQVKGKEDELLARVAVEIQSALRRNLSLRVELVRQRQHMIHERIAKAKKRLEENRAKIREHQVKNMWTLEYVQAERNSISADLRKVGLEKDLSNHRVELLERSTQETQRRLATDDTVQQRQKIDALRLVLQDVSNAANKKALEKELMKVEQRARDRELERVTNLQRFREILSETKNELRAETLHAAELTAKEQFLRRSLDEHQHVVLEALSAEATALRLTSEIRAMEAEIDELQSVHRKRAVELETMIPIHVQLWE